MAAATKTSVCSYSGSLEKALVEANEQIMNGFRCLGMLHPARDSSTTVLLSAAQTPERTRTALRHLRLIGCL